MDPKLPRTACVHLPYLAAALALRDEPELAGLPLVIVDGPGTARARDAEAAAMADDGRDPANVRATDQRAQKLFPAARIVDASAEARLAGVTRGMALDRARALQPELVARPARPEVCREAFVAMLQALRDLTPEVEPGGIDHAWLSVDGFVASMGDARSFGLEIDARVGKALGIAVRVGVAPGKFSSRILTDYLRRRAVMVLPPAQAVRFLGGLPVRELPLAADRVEDLRRLGVVTLGQFAALPARSIRPRFGDPGWRAYLLARGWDDARVQPWECEPRLKSRHVFPEPLANARSLQRRVEQLALRVGAVLVEHYGMVGTVRLGLAFASGRSEARSVTLIKPLAGARSLVDPALVLLAEHGAADPVTAVELAAQGICATEARVLSRFRRAGGSIEEASAHREAGVGSESPMASAVALPAFPPQVVSQR